MAQHWQIRAFTPADFPSIMRLEEMVFGAAGEDTLGAYYVRLCCEFFPDTCFIATVDGRTAGYVLCFVRGREAYGTTLPVAPELQGGPGAWRLVPAPVRAIS